MIMMIMVVMLYNMIYNDGDDDGGISGTNCSLFVDLQVSPLSATRLASLVNQRETKEERSLEFSGKKEGKQGRREDKEGKQPTKDKEGDLSTKDCLINIPMSAGHSTCENGASNKQQNEKDDLINQPKVRKFENVCIREEMGGEIVKFSERMVLLNCENGARLPNFESGAKMPNFENDAKMPNLEKCVRMPDSQRSAQIGRCEEKPGRFEMLI